ncbi:Uncharacterised protein [Corynebacterium kutscheri]|uniref:Uncharacterized protein n=1 Tax=Corynebacterium kutscheri TaxID=35755 RepID=A0AB38VTW9_9CORY|nr:Uncharacterised protein [Corynebacterium kutscheri]
MQSLRFFLTLFIIWSVTQICIWGFSEIVVPGSRLESILGTEDIGIGLKVFTYALFPLPFSIMFTRRLVNKDNT